MNLPFGTQMAVAGMISLAIGYMKKSKYFPWITAESSKVNRVAMIVLSGLATLGIHFSYNAGTLLISGLTLASVGAGVWHWIVQCFVSHGWYKGLSMAEQILSYVRPPDPVEMAEKQREFFRELAAGNVAPSTASPVNQQARQNT